MPAGKMDITPNTFRNWIIAVTSILPGLRLSSPGSVPGDFHRVIQAVSRFRLRSLGLDNKGLHRVTLSGRHVLLVLQPDQGTGSDIR